MPKSELTPAPMTAERHAELQDAMERWFADRSLVVELVRELAASERYWQQKVAQSPEFTWDCGNNSGEGDYDFDDRCFWCGGERYYDRAREMYRVEHVAGCVWLVANGLKEGEWKKESR